MESAPGSDSAPADQAMIPVTSHSAPSWVLADYQRVLQEASRLYSTTAALGALIEEYDDAVSRIARIVDDLEEAAHQASGHGPSPGTCADLAMELRDCLDRCIQPAVIRDLVDQAMKSEESVIRVLATDERSPLRLGEGVIRRPIR
jgi:hypothetical protein